MSWEFFDKRTVAGRKDYRCEECRVALPKGTKHVYCHGKCEGEMMDYRLCDECDLISTEWCRAYDDGEGWPMGDLRSWLRDEGVADPLAWAEAQQAARGAASVCVSSSEQDRCATGSTANQTPIQRSEPNASAWLPIESAPKDGTAILALLSGGGRQVVRWTNHLAGSEACWRLTWSLAPFAFSEVVGWVSLPPLPSPPSADEAQP